MGASDEMNAGKAKVMSAWIEEIFRSREAQEDGIVRRSIVSVHENGGIDELKRVVAERRFRLFRVADQYVILCVADAEDVPLNKVIHEVVTARVLASR